jgi:hypothetical protein
MSLPTRQDRIWVAPGILPEWYTEAVHQGFWGGSVKLSLLNLVPRLCVELLAFRTHNIRGE